MENHCTHSHENYNKLKSVDRRNHSMKWGNGMGRESVASRIDTKLAGHLEKRSFGKVLAVGDIYEWKERGNPLPPKGDISFLAFHDVNEFALAVIQPSIIYSPVLARNFDCIELAMLLQNIGYTGIYRAVIQDLPKPELIEREVRQMCAGLRFEIVQP